MLETKKHRLIAALLTARTNGEAAKMANISSRTVYKWLEDPEFRSALAKAEQDCIAHAARLVSDAAVDAVKTLTDILKDPKASHKTKATTAGILLANLPRLRMMGSLEMAILELQQAAQANMN